MTLKEKLKKVWENREQIAEGWWNVIFSMDKEMKAEAERRIAICEGCEYYNKEGDKEIIVLKGQPGCLLCGCNIKALCHTMSATCSATKIGLKPRWEAVIDTDTEKEINQKLWEQQFNKPKDQ